MTRVSRISDVYCVYFHHIVYLCSVCSLESIVLICRIPIRAVHGDSFGVRHSFFYRKVLRVFSDMREDFIRTTNRLLLFTKRMIFQHFCRNLQH